VTASTTKSDIPEGGKVRLELSALSTILFLKEPFFEAKLPNTNKIGRMGLTAAVSGVSC